jgi:hypothetical protein
VALPHGAGHAADGRRDGVAELRAVGRLRTRVRHHDRVRDRAAVRDGGRRGLRDREIGFRPHVERGARGDHIAARAGREPAGGNRVHVRGAGRRRT